VTVGLRAALPEDAERIALWLNAEWARRWLSANLRAGAMNAGLVRAALRRPDQRWFVATDGEAPAGLVVLDQIDTADGLANLWYVLGDAAARGRGTMPAAIDRLCRENPAGLHVVTAWAGAPNAASRRCLEKAGFRVIGRVSGAFAVDGRHDRILFERVLAPGAGGAAGP
jgi:RimJ/RimL family protein N-acetyltransferase